MRDFLTTIVAASLVLVMASPAGQVSARPLRLKGILEQAPRPTHGLLQNPRLWSAGFLGAAGLDSGNAVATGSDGSINLAGVTSSSGLATTSGVVQEKPDGGFDGFVARFEADGATLDAASYLGGRGDDGINALVVDGRGDVYVAGYTDSGGFPRHTAAHGGTDAFVVELSPDLSRILHAVRIGGDRFDSASALALEPDGEVVVAGLTRSSDLPTTAGALQPHSGGGLDGFVAVLSATHWKMHYLSYLGGHADDVLNALAVLPDGALALGGSTDSHELAGHKLPSDGPGGDEDGLLAILQPSGHGAGDLLAALRVGGRAADTVQDVAAGPDGVLWGVGDSNSADLPVTRAGSAGSNPPQPSGKAFLGGWRLRNQQLRVVDLQTLGGTSGDIEANALAFGDERLYVAGGATTTDLPMPGHPYQAYNRGGGGDVFLDVFDLADPAKPHLSYATYFGGSYGADTAHAVAIGPYGRAILTGSSGAFDMPVTGSATQGTLGGAIDAILVELGVPGG